MDLNLKIILLILLIQKVYLCTPPSFMHSRNYYYPNSNPANKFVNGIISANEHLLEGKQNYLKSWQEDNELKKSFINNNIKENESIKLEFNENEKDELLIPLIKNNRPIVRILSIESHNFRKSIKLVKEDLNSTVNHTKNYKKLLDCMKISLKPFDGISLSNNFITREEINLKQNCSFEIGECSFYSSEEGNLQFTIGQFNKLNNEKCSEKIVNDIIGRNRELIDLPIDKFLVVINPGGNNANYSAILKLEIFCQKGDGQINFNYWTTDSEISLKVCTIILNKSECTSEIKYYESSPSVAVNVVNPTDSDNEDNHFSVEIIVGNFKRPSIFILDNLYYEANSCPFDKNIRKTRLFGTPFYSKILPTKIFTSTNGTKIEKLVKRNKISNGLKMFNSTWKRLGPINSDFNEQKLKRIRGQSKRIKNN
ncbi:hypothetical protein ACQ4LE_009797 [Meloidogyne hapla]